MPLVFVTGIAGSGKSTVCEELKARGHEAYDSDRGGFSDWFDKETGEKLDRNVTPVSKAPEFQARYQWKILSARVEELVPAATDRFVFVCGSGSNQNEIRGLFNKVIALVVDEETLRQRIIHRTTNNFGKTESEFNEILAWHKTTAATYKEFGYTIIDSTQPLAQVVDQVLSIAKRDYKPHTPSSPGMK